MLGSISEVRKQYRDYLDGKRVVIVGPAPSVVGSNQGTIIDSYDIVVRLNKALPIPHGLKNDIGTRTDVLYNCMNPSPECGGEIKTDILTENGVKFLVAPYPPTTGYRFGADIENYLKLNGQKVPFCHFDQKLFADLLKEIKLPNTGISAIIDLLSFNIKELYITGFTFFKGGYMKEYRGYNEQQVLQRMAKYNLHDQDKQLAYMKTILPNEPRVKMDNALNALMQQQYVSFSIDSIADAKPKEVQKVKEVPKAQKAKEVPKVKVVQKVKEVLKVKEVKAVPKGQKIQKGHIDLLKSKSLKRK